MYYTNTFLYLNNIVKKESMTVIIHHSNIIILQLFVTFQHTASHYTAIRRKTVTLI